MAPGETPARPAPEPDEPELAKNIEPALMTALVTEHFVLQSAASATISESGTRAAIYLSALSSGLVAIGFASTTPATLSTLIFTVLPTIYLLGWFTFVRLVDTTLENNVARARIQRIRHRYATIAPEAALYFADELPSQSMGVRYTYWSILFTIGTVIATINGVLGGATVALIAAIGLNAPAGIALPCGIAGGIVSIIVALMYERRRFTPVASVG